MYRIPTKGWFKDPVAKLHPRIILGPGFLLSPQFKETHSITHVVNCAYDESCPQWVRFQLKDKYECINAADSHEHDITDWYPQFKQVMDRFLNDPDCKTIYVHCHCGINRSAFLCLLYLCLKFDYSLETVIKSMTLQRGCTLLNPNFREQVVAYIKNHKLK